MGRPFQYRDAILELLSEHPIHPSVDWIHGRLRQRHPKVSLATVYRTLRALVSEGLLCELPFGTSESRFGLTREHKHYHFLCDVCRRVLDLPGPVKEGLERTVQKNTGHRVTRHTVEFYGRCKDCLAKDMGPTAEKPASGKRNEQDRQGPLGRKARHPGKRKERKP
jgi:Fur family transcriptional regulator, peroxide stress response regulator